jgi:hypothetical protein
MAIESVTSTTFTPPQPRADQAAQAAQAEQSRPANAPREAEPGARDTSADQTQSAPPVVNAQGQMTGKVINTVA